MTTETFLDWLVLSLALFGAFFYVPLYLRANGTRPYVVGNLVLFGLLALEASVGMFLTNGSLYPLIRLAYASFLYGITLWAVFGKEKSHV